MSYQEDVLGQTPQMLDRLHFWVGWLCVYTLVLLCGIKITKGRFCHKYNIINMYLILLKTHIVFRG